MKRILIISLVLIMVIAAAGCSSGISQEDYDDLLAKLDNLQDELDEQSDELEKANAEIESLEAAEASTDTVADDTAVEADTTPASDTGLSEIKPPAAIGTFDEDDVISQLETTSYIINGEYASYAAIVLKNTSPFNIYIDVTALFYDEAGSMIGTASENSCAFESGQETALSFYNEALISNVEFEYWVEEEQYYQAVLSSLSQEVSTTDSKAIISVTNNGDKPAQFVEYVAIFFKDGQVVDTVWGFCVDGNNEIAPGKTQRDEATTYEDFDTVQVYLSAYAD